MGSSFRYEPLSTSVFPIGEGPFRARGLAYVTALKYVDRYLPGGRAALGLDRATAAFFDQIFLVTGDYDVSPLVSLYVACAWQVGIPVGRFIEERARRSAESDSKGIWRPMLKGSSPSDAAARTHFAFNRYFPPCEAKVIAVEPTRFAGELSRIPAPMSGLYVSATNGFITASVAIAGAPGARMEWEEPIAGGEHAGVPTQTLRFAVTWGWGLAR